MLIYLLLFLLGILTGWGIAHLWLAVHLILIDYARWYDLVDLSSYDE